jgi:hypothetical protein
MSFASEREQCAAIRAFLGRVVHGRLADLWTDEGPTRTAVDYIDKGNPLSHGEAICLQIAFDVWNGRGKATVDDLLTVLDDANLSAVLDLIALARPGLRFSNSHSSPV